MPTRVTDGIAAQMIFNDTWATNLFDAGEDLKQIDDDWDNEKNRRGKARNRYEEKRFQHCRKFIKKFKHFDTFTDIDKLEKWKNKADEDDVITYAESLAWCYQCCEALLELGDGYDDTYGPYKKVRKYANKYSGRMEDWVRKEYPKIVDCCS